MRRFAGWLLICLLGWMFTMPAGAPAATQLGQVLGGGPLLIQISVNQALTPATPDPALIQMGPAPVQDDSSSSGSLCVGGDESLSQAATQYLPNGRWGGVQMLHTRQPSGFLGLNLIQTGVTVGLFSVFYGLGNVFYSIATSLNQEASRLCVADTAAGIVDHTASTIGGTIQDNQLVFWAVLLGAAIAVIMAGRAGGKNALQGIIRVLLCFLFLMLTVWRADTATTPNAGGTTPPPGSVIGAPSWYPAILTRSLQDVATVPADAILKTATTLSATTQPASTDLASCDAYIQTLYSLYDKQQTDAGISAGAALTPKALAGMWQVSAGGIFQIAQFGKNNTAGNRVWCRLMEARAGIPTLSTPASDGTPPITVTTPWGYTYTIWPGLPPTAFYIGQSDLLRLTTGTPYDQIVADSQETDPQKLQAAIHPGLLPMSFLSGGADSEDIGLFMWAACQYVDGNWTATPGWVGRDGQPIRDDQCTSVFTTTTADWAAAVISGVFNSADDSAYGWADIDLTDSDVTATFNIHTAPADEYDFVYTMQGYARWSAVGDSFIFLIAALVVGAIFTLLAASGLISNLGMWALFACLVLGQLIAMLHPRGEGILASFAKQALGFAILAFGITLIISLITLFTALAQILFSPLLHIPILGVMLTGLSPVAGVLIMSMLFTKVLKVPSPFTPKGALAWGAVFTGGAAVGSLTAAGFMSRARYSAASLRNRLDRRRYNNRPALGRRGKPGSGVAGDGRTNPIPPLRQDLPAEHPLSTAGLAGGQQRLADASNRAEAKRWVRKQNRAAVGLPEQATFWQTRQTRNTQKNTQRDQQVLELRARRQLGPQGGGVDKLPAGQRQVTAAQRKLLPLQQRLEAARTDWQTSKTQFVKDRAAGVAKGVAFAAAATSGAPVLVAGAATYAAVRGAKAWRQRRAGTLTDYQKWVNDAWATKDAQAANEQRKNQQVAPAETTETKQTTQPAAPQTGQPGGGTPPNPPNGDTPHPDGQSSDGI